MALTPHARQIISAIYATRVGRGVHGGHVSDSARGYFSSISFFSLQLSIRYLNGVNNGSESTVDGFFSIVANLSHTLPHCEIAFAKYAIA